MVKTLIKLSQNRLATNIIANFAGQGWSALVGFIFVPIYISLLGIESYGLIGFYATVQAVTNILDFGLSPTINRELAIYSTQPHKNDDSRDLVRTLEIGYWIIGTLIGIFVISLSHFIATSWLSATKIPQTDIEQVIILMGIMVIFQWPLTLYHGGISGLQRQAPLNLIIIIFNTTRGVGAITSLILIAPNILVFFSWQLIVCILEICVVFITLWRFMPKGTRSAMFSWMQLKQIWRFAGGLSGVSVVNLILRQMDKAVLSNWLTLEMFGYYTLASLISNMVGTLGSPIFIAFFPKMSTIIAQNKTIDLHKTYHYGCQLVALTTIPASLIICFFSYDLLMIWTQKESIAHAVAPILSVLAIGTGLNNLVGLPYDSQLAHGWVSLGFYKNLIAVLIFIPLLSFLVSLYGVIGAAYIWVILNMGYLFIEIPIMHRRIMPDQIGYWYIYDILIPISGTLIVIFLLRFLITPNNSLVGNFFSIVMIYLLGLITCLLTLKDLRYWIFNQLKLQKSTNI